MKKVLYITYDGLTDPLGQSQVLPYLFELEKHGYEFTIISFEKKHRFNQEGGTIRSLIAGKKIEWLPLTFTSNPPVLSKMYDRFRMWQTALTLYKRKRFQIIHCRSYVAAEVGLKLKQRFGVQFLFDMRGFWADEKVDNGQWDLSKPFYKKIYDHYKQKEKEFLLNADGIISLTQAAKNYLLDQSEFRNLSIDVIPCCADLDHFDFHKINSEKASTLKINLGIPGNAKVITYLGSVGGWYMTKEMFSFFRLMLDNDPSLHMMILTKDEPEKVRQEAAAAGIPGDKLTITYSKREDLPVYLSLSWFSIFFIRNTFSKTASSPTKHAELMGMGIPVICNAIGDTGNIIENTGTGIIVDSFDKAGYQKAILQMKDLENFSPERIRQSSIEYFDLTAGAKKYLEVYQKLLNTQKVPA